MKINEPAYQCGVVLHPVCVRGEFMLVADEDLMALDLLVGDFVIKYVGMGYGFGPIPQNDRLVLGD